MVVLRTDTMCYSFYLLLCNCFNIDITVTVCCRYFEVRKIMQYKECYKLLKIEL